MNQLTIHDYAESLNAEDSFVAKLRAFDQFGRKTAELVDGGIPYFVNEYWTAGQRQAHSLHEISYRACFKAQLPEFFISRLTKAGDFVYDPFLGRGTTIVQAALMGRNVVGNDINPLSKLLARPRLKPISVEAVRTTLAGIGWSTGKIERDDLLAFYHPTTLVKLESLRIWLNENAPLDCDDPEPVADWIRMVAINRLTGHSPGFFSGRSMPPNQAISVKSQLKINEKLGVEAPVRDVAAIILKKTRTLLSDGSAQHGSTAKLLTGLANSSPDISDGSVDLVVTSPPFLDIVQYASDNWLRCWFAGIDAENVEIAMHKTEAGWSQMVRDVLVEQARIVRPGGHVAFEVGEVRNGKVLLEQLVWKAAVGLPFERLGVMVNDQEFTKTANCWGVANGGKGTNTNRIVVLRRS